jgi:hypothetical protein
MPVMNDAWMQSRGLPLTPVTSDRNPGYIAAGFVLGVLLSLFGVAIVAIFNREASRNDTLLGSVVGAAAGLAVLALTLSFV